ncbi:MAG: hypothetical protein AMXMBFR8_30010 [Nevskiales bacterium]
MPATRHAGGGAGSGTMTVVRIAGLMRSGTNLLTWALRHNFAAVGTATMLLGWKHGPIFRDRTELGLDDYVDPRYRQNLQAFVREHPQAWTRVTASPLYRAAATQQREQNFGVALAVRDPGAWYASCLRISREYPGFLLHGVAPAAAAAFWDASHRAWLGALGERSAIVDTDALRRDPEPWLERLAAGLRLERLPGQRLPGHYLHPREMEEVYELLGAQPPDGLEREPASADAADAGQRAQFLACLDRDVLARLGLGAAR